MNKIINMNYRFILYVLISFSFFQACKKEDVKSEQQTNISDNELKQWLYENGGIYKNETIKISQPSSAPGTPANNGARLNNNSKIHEGSLDWSKKRTYEVDGLKYTSIPFKFNFGSTLFSEAVSPSQFKLIIRQKKNGDYEGALQTKIFSADIKYSDKLDIRKIEIYTNLKGKWINSWLYQEDGPVKVFQKSSGASINGRLRSCSNFSLTSYSTRCYYPNGSTSTNDLVCYSVPHTETYSFCDDGGPEDEETFPPDDGGGSGGGFPPNNDDNDGIPEPKDIINNITDPCLNDTYNTVTAQNLKNKITDILHNTFGSGATKDFNLRFESFNLGNDFLDGHTNATIGSNGRMDFEIQLNTGTLLNASKEFTGATIYHEILHAYLRTTGLIGRLNHENAIASSYATHLMNALLSAFPGLSSIDAKALAWGGLEGTTALDLIKINDPAEYDVITVRNSKHKIGKEENVGTPCN